MSTHKIPDFSDAESPERTANDHPVSAADTLKEDKSKGGFTLRKVEDKDLNKDRDKNQTSIKEPDSGKKEIKEPPPRKTSR